MQSKKRVGVILAGGNNSRLRPSTLAVPKSLAILYNKPLIYYSLSLLLLAKIRDILIITTEYGLLSHQKLLGDGSKLGLNITYKVQEKPGGLPEAFILGEEFIGNNSCCLVLSDNVLYGDGLSEILQNVTDKGATCLGYSVNSPENYGVIKLNGDKVVDIIEKPAQFVSNYAVPGIYFCDKTVVNRAKKLKPSKRGELEIVDILKSYLSEDLLDVRLISRGYMWADCGGPDSLLDSSNFIASIEKRQGLKIGVIEEICFRNDWIDKKQLLKLAEELGGNEYSKYLESL